MDNNDLAQVLERELKSFLGSDWEKLIEQLNVDRIVLQVPDGSASGNILNFRIELHPDQAEGEFPVAVWVSVSDGHRASYAVLSVDDKFHPTIVGSQD